MHHCVLFKKMDAVCYCSLLECLKGGVDGWKVSCSSEGMVQCWFTPICSILWSLVVFILLFIEDTAQPNNKKSPGRYSISYFLKCLQGRVAQRIASQRSTCALFSAPSRSNFLISALLKPRPFGCLILFFFFAFLLFPHYFILSRSFFNRLGSIILFSKDIITAWLIGHMYDF